MKLSTIKVNAAAEQNGRWIPASGLPDVSFKVRGFNSDQYKELRRKLLSEIPRADRIKGLSEAAADKIDTQLLVEAILLDWKGLEDDNGAPLKFTAKKAAELLANPDYRVLREAITGCAALVGEDALAQTEADAKN